MKKKQDEQYQITLKGLVTQTLNNVNLAQKVLDEIELYLRRHYQDNKSYPAIILTDKGFVFGKVGREKK